jgi:hypothetical protein
VQPRPLNRSATASNLHVVPRKLSLVALIALGMLPAAANADWAVSAATQARYDDNVGNAQDYDDKVSDEIIGATLSAYQLVPLSSGYLLTAGGELSGEWFDHLRGLRNASAEGLLSIKRKWGWGAFAPWARASVSVGRSEFDASYRDFTTYRTSLAAGKRFDERWNLWVEYSFEHRAAAAGENVEPGISADAFTLNGHRLAVSMEYSVNSKLYIDLGLFARRGDVVSTVQADEAIYAGARAVEEDPALGEDAYAYRVIGNTYGLRPGVSYSLTEHSLLSLSYLRARTYAQSADYVKSVTELAWSYRF